MVFEKIQEIICEEFKVDASKVTLDTRLKEDLNADSLDATELIMAIEEEFSIEVSDEKAQTIRTVRDIVDFVKSTR